jgi:hypothetical protein
MLAGVIEIYDLNGTRELFLTDVPDPVGAVAHNGCDSCPAPATLMGLGVDAAGELGGSLDGSGQVVESSSRRGPAWSSARPN